MTTITYITSKELKALSSMLSKSAANLVKRNILFRNIGGKVRILASDGKVFLEIRKSTLDLEGFEGFTISVEMVKVILSLNKKEYELVLNEGQIFIDNIRVDNDKDWGLSIDKIDNYLECVDRVYKKIKDVDLAKREDNCVDMYDPEITYKMLKFLRELNPQTNKNTYLSPYFSIDNTSMVQPINNSCVVGCMALRTYTAERAIPLPGWVG